MDLTYLIFTIFIIGTLLFFYKDISSLYMQIKMYRRLVARARDLNGKHKVFAYIDMMAETVIGIRGDSLIKILMGLFLLIMGFAKINTSMSKSFLVAFTIELFIIMLIFLKFQSIRKRGSFEGENLIVNFLNQYRMCHYNIYETLEKLTLTKKEAKRKATGIENLIKKLLLDIRNTGNKYEIKKATDEFANIIDTNWSRIFAYNLNLAVTEGWNITNAIEDILIQLRDARTLEEERNRLNSETVRIITYMIPILYILTVVMSLKFAGMTVKQFIKNQFITSEGFAFFIISIIVFLFNLILVELVTKRKFDY